MKKRHPEIVRTLTYKRLDADRVEVKENFSDNLYEVSVHSARLMQKLDGKTDPYTIPTPMEREEVEELLLFLKEHDLLQRRRLRLVFPLYVLLPLVQMKRIKLVRLLACLSNWILMLTWIPMLLAGIVCYDFWQYDMEFNGLGWGLALGYASGLVLHELGHAFACYSYKARVYEMGVGLMLLLCPIFYVMLKADDARKRMQRIQIYAAGIETNFWLCGLYLICATVLFPAWGGLFLEAAMVNALLGGTNLLCMVGLDGGKILSELLGDSYLFWSSIVVMFGVEERKKIARKGITGYAIIAMYFLLGLMQIGWVAILLSTIWEGVRLFL